MECGRREWSGVHRKFCYDRVVVVKMMTEVGSAAQLIR